jgi:hypothetical protein
LGAEEEHRDTCWVLLRVVSYERRGKRGGGVVNRDLRRHKVGNVVYFAPFHEAAAEPVSPQDQNSSWQALRLQAL